MFNKVLIANRGAIACRIIRTLKQLGIKSVVVYSTPDSQSLHVSQADEAYLLEGAMASDTYLHQDKILAIAKTAKAEAIHPGYGFLSENKQFAERCEKEGIIFIGPRPEHISEFGLKHTARDLAEKNKLPLLPGTSLLESLEQAISAAEDISYPVMLKSTAGGGGIGMQLCYEETELSDAYDSVKRLGENNFSDGGIFLEKFVARARHIEVQIFGDGKGNVVALGERDCSLQRRNQKVVEETPAALLSDKVRNEMIDAAVNLASDVAYQSAGTVEFIYDPQQEKFYFLEVNTRLQVEHGVTEQVTGIDLVAWMVCLASGDLPALDQSSIKSQGHSIQVRLYAEDPGQGFQPSTGLVTQFSNSDRARVDTWLEAGIEVPAYYDPMLAKIIVTADSREQAIVELSSVLAETQCSGIETNISYLQQVINTDVFNSATHYTRFLDQYEYHASTIDVLDAGTLTTVQDYPGRIGYWAIGVPPSGPMDNYSFRLGNRLLENSESAAGLELTASGPELKFNTDSVIVLTGATMPAFLDDREISYCQAIEVSKGSVLKIGQSESTGMRAYLCVKGGIKVPDYLASKSTFTLGRFGGHAGRQLQPGDVLHIESTKFDKNKLCDVSTLNPEISNHWDIKCIYGPHGAPDFFTEQDISTFFNTDWEVHYNSSRTGVRLIGPKPEWAREDGGEAGLHPSNIHDNAYAIGTIDFTGDMPIILGPDGPSLGGFVCPATIIKADLWKMGQLRPGDSIRFIPVSMEEAVHLEQKQNESLLNLKPSVPDRYPVIEIPATAVLDHSQQNEIEVTYRPSGDDYLLVEYGELKLDLNLRFRVHILMQWLQENGPAEIIDLTPGIRSLQIHYDNLRLPLNELMSILHDAENELPGIDEIEVPTRTVHLPLSWDDASTQLAIEKYMQSVRKDAPWCPSNIEFIRRINGLGSIEDVKRIVFDAHYLVMGLGDVYLGAPVATPLDPRHRLVTTKYNPARTWTPENAVGIGGAYLCVYGMEGPGGYQFVGRTIQMWNRFKVTQDFKEGKPWLLRFFDQLSFYPVESKELEQMRHDFPAGKFKLNIEEGTFQLKEYNAFLNENNTEIEQFKQSQKIAFNKEREQWKSETQYSSLDVAGIVDDDQKAYVPLENETVIKSPVTGSLWKLEIEQGDKVNKGDSLMILESMKMEIQVVASNSGTVKKILSKESAMVKKGQDLLVLEIE